MFPFVESIWLCLILEILVLQTQSEAGLNLSVVKVHMWGDEGLFFFCFEKCSWYFICDSQLLSQPLVVLQS